MGEQPDDVKKNSRGKKRTTIYQKSPTLAMGTKEGSVGGGKGLHEPRNVERWGTGKMIRKSSASYV